MDTQEKPKTRKRRPRKKPPRQELTVDQARVLLRNSIGDIKGININWNDLRRVSSDKYIFQITVDKLSMKVLNKLQEMPLVEDVYFFAKVGAGQHGINLLFKIHIVFEKL